MLTVTNPPPSWSWHHPRNKQARATMARPAAANARAGAVYTMGYHAVMGTNVRPSLDWLQGSSLNRRKNENQLQIERIAAAKKNVSPEVDALPRGRRLDPLYRIKTDLFGVHAYDNERPNRSAKAENCISKRSRGKIKDKFTALFRAGKPCTFVTLSFIQSVKDKTGVAVLNKWLTALRKKEGSINYIWVAERQKNNNGNIHFHLLIDRRLDIVRYNGLWVLQQYNEGLKGFSRKSGTYISKEQIKSAFKNGQVQNFFNPFDIRKVKSITGLSSYLTKYVSKGTDSFACRAWHCSRGVSRTFTKTVISLELFQECASEKNSYVNKETGELFEAKTIVTAFSVIRYIMNKKYFSQYMRIVDEVNKAILYEKFVPDLLNMEDQFYWQYFHNSKLN